MAKKEEKVLTLSERLKKLLTKLCSVFQSDMYIIEGRFCIEGPKTSKVSTETCICVLEEKERLLISEYYQGKNFLYFTDMKKYKNLIGKPEGYEFLIIDGIKELEKKEVFKKRDDLMREITFIDKWERFRFTEDTIKAFFDMNEKIILFSDNPNIPEVPLAKSIVPLIKPGDLEGVYYSTMKISPKIYSLVINYQHPEFQLYIVYKYFKYKKMKGED